LEKPKLRLLDVIKTISQASLLVWYEQEISTLKRQKLVLGSASRTNSTKAVVGYALPKINSSRVGLSNKKFTENSI
jgi:hypothetical protein